MKNKKNYAVIQTMTDAIYGVGDTIDEALEQATKTVCDDDGTPGVSVEYLNKELEKNRGSQDAFVLKMIDSDDDLWGKYFSSSTKNPESEVVNEEHIRNCDKYLDSLDLVDNDLIRAGIDAGYNSDVVVSLVYGDDVEETIAYFCRINVDIGSVDTYEKL
jgi:hypothetical protein